MRIQALGSTASRVFGVLAAALWLSSSAAAELVNIDFEGDPPNDTTHSGADGVLSSAGTLWNGVASGVDASGLLDDSGSATPFDVVFTSTGGGASDPSSTNDLQDSGSFRGHDIQGLVSTTQYDVAIYAAPFSFISFTDSTGTSFLSCVGSPTYSLPGTIGSDYCLFEDRLPADLGGGEHGFSVSGLDGVVMAIQIRGEGGTDPPAVPALSGSGIVLLILGLLGAGGCATRRSK